MVCGLVLVAVHRQVGFAAVEKPRASAVFDMVCRNETFFHALLRILGENLHHKPLVDNAG